MPRPVVADQIPIARAWSSASRKTLMTIERVAGMMQAAPRPMTDRATINAVTDAEKADAAEPAAKTASPAQKTFLRPTRSPMLPATSRSPANTQA